MARRVLGVCGAVLGCLAAGVSAAVPAVAGPPPYAGTATVGSATVQTTGAPTALNPLGPCDVNGTRSADTRGGAIPGVVSFGAGATTCGYDPATATSTMTATGHDFTLTALVPYGGPEIGIDNVAATCQGTRDHSSAWFQLGPYRGFVLPAGLPPGYTVTVPGTAPGEPPLATLEFGELAQPPIPDGSLRLTAVHITLFPQGGPAEGDVYVGSVYCTLTH